MQFGRDLSFEEARKFVRMYVNSDTLSLGAEGRDAILKLFNLAFEKNIINQKPVIDIMHPKY